MEQTGAIALEFAGFWRRLAAAIIDAMLSVVIIGFVTNAFFPVHWLPMFNVPSWVPVMRDAFSSAVSTVLQAAYSVGFWSWRGQTPGKMALNIKVIRTDGSNITLGYALLRYLGYFVSAIMLGIGFLWIAFDARKQGIHDKIADTYVVKLPAPAPNTRITAADPRAV